MKVAIEQIFNGSIPQVAIGGAYDPTMINRGKHTGQYNLGSNVIDKFVGPAPIGVANFGESPLAMPSPFVSVVKITNDLFWVFGADAAAAAATRRVQLWTWIPSTNTYTFVGWIVLTFPTTGNVTARGIKVILTNYTTGTINASGTAVTGVGTLWNTGLSVGSRIGFGSTDPLAITTWYQISAIGSDTSITLTGSAGTIPAGTPYVIQDLMIVHANTNGTTVTNGGLFVVKGLRIEDFWSTGNTIPAATTVDKIKAVYWLKDAATVTNTVIGGCAPGDLDSWTQQYVYSTNGSTTSLVLYRYNIRAPLTLTAGAATLTGSDIVITGTQTVTGNVQQNNNGKVATLQHGAGAGVPSLYLYTASRILRAPLSGITGGSTTFVADSMAEVPPGGTNTNIASSGGFSHFDIDTSLDKLVIAVAGSSTGSIFVTDYYTGGQQLDRRGGCIASPLPSALRNTDIPIFFHCIGGSSPRIYMEDGWLFAMYNDSTTTTTNALTAYPLAADLEYQTDVNNRVILPKISLGSVPCAFYRVLINPVKNIGDNIYGVTPDMYTVEYRTSGIDDNSGAWTSVNQDGDLSKVLLSSNIQFAIRFRTAGVVMLPARILSLSLVYETSDGLPSQHRWDNDDFNLANNIFGFKQVERFYSTPYIHTINIYRQDTNALVLTQNSQGNANGNFQYWNGTTWVNGLDGDSVGLRRRFVPTASLPATSLYANISYVIVPESILSGAVMYVDAANSASYPGPSQPGPAPKWYDISGASPSMTMDLDPSYWATGSGYPTFDSVDGGGSWDFSFFNGGGTSNSIPNLITPTSGFTIGIWLKLKQFNTWSGATGLYNGDALICFLTQPSFTSVNSDASVYIHGSISSQTIFAKFDNTWGTQSGIVGSGYTASDLNTWVYLVFTVNCAAGGAITSYKNGVQQSTSTLSNALNLANTRVIWSGYNAIGVGNNGKGSSAKYGVIQIYNRILSASEIAQNFTANRYRFGL